MKYGLLILLLLTSVAQAQVYRTVDKNGNVVYSDVEDDNSEEVIIDIAPSYSPTEIVPLEVESDIDEPEEIDVIAPNYLINITSPEQNETFQNPESVDVSISITPELHSIRADKLLFKLDGQDVGESQTATTITLPYLERGSHILLVSAVDKTGKVIKSSKSILFHVHRSVAKKINHN